MIVWGGTAGGLNFLNTGGRYNPSTDSWTATSTTNAPAGRVYHTAVWTGSQMIVWGGYDSSTYFDTGGRYNPSTDSWTATSTTNAPAPREGLAGGLAGARQPDGFVTVTPTLQVAGHDRVFALGDVAAADHKMAGAATRQAAIVAGNIRALIAGQGELDQYQPPPPGIVVPIGPDGGAGQRGGQDEAAVGRGGGRAQGPGHDGGPVHRAARRPGQPRAGRY